MADKKIPMDQRNPFAPWGFEEVKYSVEASEDGSIVELENNGFEGQLTDSGMYNEIVVNTNYAADPQESFFTNNDTQKYEPVATHAYGFNKDLQPEREAGEPLNYYGIQAEDLKLYEAEENDSEDGENETPTNDTDTSESGSTNGSTTEPDDQTTNTSEPDTTNEPNGEESGNTDDQNTDTNGGE